MLGAALQEPEYSITINHAQHSLWLCAERRRRPLPVTLPWSCTSCSARTLVGISLADGIHL